jgi:zinc/manganese transport system permease protein
MYTDLLGQQFVHNALLAGAVVGIVSGAIGFFIVTRGASFAVHAMSELGFTGAAGALWLGLSPVVGLVGGSLVVGLALGLLSLRGRERDSAIGSVLAFGLGVGVLFLSLYQGYATEATNLLFGSVVAVSRSQLAGLALVSLLVIAGIAACYRPLLFSSVDPEVAEARGVPMRALSVATSLLLALTTAEAVQVVGVLLVLTLVITPAAAQRLAVNPATAIVLAMLIAVAATEGGILLSLEWGPSSFWISALSFAVYLAARTAGWGRLRSSA